MIRANFSARSGLIAQQQRLDIIANNIANVNNQGYKSVRTDFRDALYSNMVRPVESQEEFNLLSGNGVLFSASTRNFNQGALENTGKTLDLALEGPGFFTVADNEGNTFYTRQGSFAISVEEGASYLVNPDGYYLLSADGEKIDLQGTNPSEVTVDKMGNVSVTVYTPATETTPATSEIVEAGRLGIARFMNPKGLDAVSSNLFAVTENSGEATDAIPEDAEEGVHTKVFQGALEMSNVELATEMTRMIRAQRSFSLASRALTTADEMDGRAIAIRR